MDSAVHDDDASKRKNEVGNARKAGAERGIGSPSAFVQSDTGPAVSRREDDGGSAARVQAEMTLKYCQGSARFAETLVGWSRDAVEVGLAEYRTGLRCVGAPSAWSGRKRWEEK